MLSVGWGTALGAIFKIRDDMRLHAEYGISPNGQPNLPKVKRPQPWPPPPKAIGETMSQDDKIAAFLYLLMRDHLPVGTVSTLINEVRDMQGTPQYTTEGLGRCAEHFGVRLTEDTSDRPKGFS